MPTTGFVVFDAERLPTAHFQTTDRPEVDGFILSDILPSRCTTAFSMIPGKILIIDDDPYVRLSAQMLLEQHFEAVTVINRPEALTILLQEESFDAVLLDMNFRRGERSGRQGLHWLTKIIAADLHTSVVLITAYGDVNLAVQAMKAGAVDFVLKPWQNEQLVSTVKAAFERSQAQRAARSHQDLQPLPTTTSGPFAELIGISDAMTDLFNMLEKVAPTDASVLITGENGTGKALVARALHRLSKRAQEVFMNVDLGALTESLFESELFGHVKGAFTDAHEDRIGRFEAASGGTLFLDELGNLSLPLQAKLLTALQNKQIFRVGSSRPRAVDVRLICATNRDLSEMIRSQMFREDLLYRINTVELHIPPLRERPADIKLLVDHYLAIYRHQYAKPGLRVSASAKKSLARYPWPGNVRELQHAVERAVILSETSVLEISDFAIPKNAASGAIRADTYNLEQLEAWAIQNALKKHNGNITRAAEEVGLTRGAMYRRMEKHGL